MKAMDSDAVIKQCLVERCMALEKELEGDVVFIRAPMTSGIDTVVRREIESLNPRKTGKRELVVVLETTGGSIEVVERISDIFRHHYASVVFVIPNFAYSAGTVLALSGDEIYMDYYSVLGPIDPQIRNRNGRWVPGLGYLEKYNALIAKSASGQMTTAEMEFLVRKFDPAELFALEQAKKHSVELIQKWLCQYKFKDWKFRQNSGEKVSPELKEKRAKEIANLLGDPTEWYSHGRGIPMRALISDRVKLKIKDFADTPTLNASIRQYYDLVVDYCHKTSADMAVHTKNGLWLSGGVNNVSE